MKNKIGPQTLEVWKPLDDINGAVVVDGVHDDFEGFRIILRMNELPFRVLRVGFDATLAYRNIDEGDHLRTWNELEKEAGWSFFTVNNSEFKRDFLDLSYGIHEQTDIEHYAIYTLTDCLDVLSIEPPDVEWL